MSTLAVEQTTLEGLGPEPTLDDRIVRAWADLRSHRIVECPVCHGDMAPEWGAHALPIGGRCTDCGATLE